MRMGRILLSDNCNAPTAYMPASQPPQLSSTPSSSPRPPASLPGRQLPLVMQLSPVVGVEEAETFALPSTQVHTRPFHYHKRGSSRVLPKTTTLRIKLVYSAHIITFCAYNEPLRIF